MSRIVTSSYHTRSRGVFVLLSPPQINFFFPSLHPTPLLTGDSAVSYIKSAVATSVSTPLGPVTKTLHSTLIEGLTALCKAKPAAGDAVRWLGEWLIDNNPRAVAAEEATDAPAFYNLTSSAGAGAGAGSSKRAAGPPVVPARCGFATPFVAAAVAIRCPDVRCVSPHACAPSARC